MERARYISGVKVLYDAAGSADSPTAAAQVLRARLDAPGGADSLLYFPSPRTVRKRGGPAFVQRPADVEEQVAFAIAGLIGYLRTSQSMATASLPADLVARIGQATAAIKRSKSAPLDVPPPPGAERSQDISLGAIAGLRIAEGDLMAANDRNISGEAVSVKVKAVKTAGSAILLRQTLEVGGLPTTLQSTILSVDSLAWSAIERSFSSTVREQLAAVAQQMVLALGPELTNAWFVVEELVASIRADLDATTATAETSDTPPGDQVEITMGDGSVLKGQLAPAKVPFVSGYGTIEVATSAITSFADGRLALEDGSVLKGAFGEGDLALTTAQGTLRLPTREIVGMSRTSTREPVAQASATTPAPAVAEDQAVLVGRVLNRFKRPVSGATVRVVGSNLRTTTDSSGNYRLPYMPGKFRVVIEKEGHDSEEIELDLAQMTTYPVEDKYLTPVPQYAGLYFQGKRAWVPMVSCQIELAERDTGAFSGGVNRWIARGQVAPIVNEGTSYFLDLTGAKRVALLPVSADGTILRMVRQGGIYGMNQWWTNSEPVRQEVDKVAVRLNWGTVGNDRRVFWAVLSPGVYALVSLPAVELGRWTTGIGLTCYMFDLRTAAALRASDTQLSDRTPTKSGPAAAPGIRRGALGKGSGDIAGQVGPTPTRWRVLTERARIRAAPATDAEILATLPAGTLLPLTTGADPRAEWLAVRFDGRDAFVARRLTRPAAPPTAEQQTIAPGQQQAGQPSRSRSNRPYTELHVEPGQTTAWIWVPQGGCVNWDADGAWVWIATPDGKVVLYSPGIRPTHIAFTAPETRAVNVRYYIDPRGKCADAVP